LLLNCTIKDNFVLRAKNHGIASLILSWQDHFKVKEERKTRLEIKQDCLNRTFLRGEITQTKDGREG